MLVLLLSLLRLYFCSLYCSARSFRYRFQALLQRTTSRPHLPLYPPSLSSCASSTSTQSCCSSSSKLPADTGGLIGPSAPSS